MCSCEYLQKQPFISPLDGVNPFGPVDQVKHMNRQGAACRVEIDPYRSRRRGNDGGKCCQAIGITKLKRNFDEARDPSSSCKAQDDGPDCYVGLDDVYEDQSSKTADGADAPQTGFRGLQSRERPATGKCDDDAQKHASQRECLVQQ